MTPDDEYGCQLAAQALGGGDSTRYRAWMQQKDAREARRLAAAAITEKFDSLERTPPMPEHTYAPPDGYRLNETRRAAEAADAAATTFEATYRASRAREFDEERTRRAAFVAEHPSPPRLTTAETARYAPPNSYAPLKEK